MHPDARRETLPAEAELTISASGVVRTLKDCPHGYKHEYHFATPELHRHAGAKARTQFDPLHIEEGAFITLAAPWRGMRAGTVLADCAPCISPAPTLYGCLDPRGEASRLKKASRALVSNTVAMFDERGATRPALPPAYCSSGAVPPEAPPTRAALPEPQEPDLATEDDWADFRAAAGVLS